MARPDVLYADGNQLVVVLDDNRLERLDDVRIALSRKGDAAVREFGLQHSEQKPIAGLGRCCLDHVQLCLSVGNQLAFGMRHIVCKGR